MEKIQLMLDSVEKVREFSNAAARVKCNFDLKSGRYIVDGKSIMGIFSLDLTKPVEVLPASEGEKKELLEAFHEFIK
mgnify:CR=1 FL=1